MIRLSPRLQWGVRFQSRMLGMNFHLNQILVLLMQSNTGPANSSNRFNGQDFRRSGQFFKVFWLFSKLDISKF
ncbi:hypothetical protein GIB67_025832 [Kingdonia uniflora]|uniref:Uncharacterized protein n=1 Tax=Kingdonia uniflora TaxID=39325 RepID=A0A7J7N4L6_9MAGN|nr:hypothetical protein GIB67_025832 [Kingdonia uniflora]